MSRVLVQQFQVSKGQLIQLNVSYAFWWHSSNFFKHLTELQTGWFSKFLLLHLWWGELSQKGTIRSMTSEILRDFGSSAHWNQMAENHWVTHFLVSYSTSSEQCTMGNSEHTLSHQAMIWPSRFISFGEVDLSRVGWILPQHALVNFIPAGFAVFHPSRFCWIAIPAGFAELHPSRASKLSGSGCCRSHEMKEFMLEILVLLDVLVMTIKNNEIHTLNLFTFRCQHFITS